MIFVRRLPISRTSWTLEAERVRFGDMPREGGDYFTPEQIDDLPEDVVAEVPHLQRMKRFVDEGRIPHAEHLRFQAVELLYGADVAASLRTIMRGTRVVDRMRSRIVTEYLITAEADEPPARVELRTYVNGFADAAQAFSFQGSSARSRGRLTVVLPDGERRVLNSAAESRVLPAEGIGAGGGVQAGPVGGEASGVVPNMNPQGPADDPQTDSISLQVTSFPATITLLATYELTATNHHDFNLAAARIRIDHSLDVRQGNVRYAKHFDERFGVFRPLLVSDAPDVSVSLEGAPDDPEAPEGYEDPRDSGGWPLPTRNEGLSPSPSADHSSLPGTLSDDEEGALAMLEKYPQAVAKTLAEGVRRGDLSWGVVAKILKRLPQ